MMYQNIDQIEPDTSAKPAKPQRTRWWLMFAVAVGIAFFLIFIYDTESGKIDQAASDAMRAERASYKSALTEPSAALRRARLSDYLATYPKSDRKNAVIAQLDVLHAEEANSWASLTEIVFNPETTREEKLAALDVYEDDWGSTLLGGRDDEIQALREELSANIKKFPNRKLKENKTSVPNDVEDSVLVGGPKAVAPKAIAIAPPAPATVETVKRVVTPPKLVKSSPPGYPRKALRRNVRGLVTVSLIIDRKGRVDDVEVVSVEAQSYQKAFAKSARRAAYKSRYTPKMVNGVAVETRGHVKQYVFEPG